MDRDDSKRYSNQIFVTKYSGESELYSEKKLRKSLERSGASPSIIKRIISQIQKDLYSGISTKTLYQVAFRLLRKESRHFAARYSLKKAIMNLGPSGFPFEKFVAAILNEMGYKTTTNITLQGRCISHEIDVIATVKDKKTFVECKFHNQQGFKSDVKIALYVSARAHDLKLKSKKGEKNEFFLITNTSFTSDAIKYGECIGLKMLGWNYPKDKSFKDTLESVHLHPETLKSDCHLTL